jgi:aspartyl aminopeptidase
MEVSMSEYKSKSYQFKNVWASIDDEKKETIFEFAQGYKQFLDSGKTERESAREIVRLARAKGFESLEDYIRDQRAVVAGTKLYTVNRDKSVILFVVGQQPLEKGMRIVGGHIDVPRIDLKPFPLYEDGELALFKTHYYGGIKKYQWTSMPLSLHGRIVKRGGEVVDISIGEDEEDPVFFITDLLPHLAKDQMAKTLGEGITGEGLNVLIGSIPISDEGAKEKVKEAMLVHLSNAYGICEEDFVTAEIEIVPAGKARDVGFDRSMISAYGHDDRVCSYAGVAAIFDVEIPEFTSVGMFMDKEEVGSQGNTGSESVYFENCVAELLALQGVQNTDLSLRRAFHNTKVLSADVTAAFDPNYPEVLDKRNAARINYGICFSKYTGVRGKGGCSDANAEFIAYVRDVFETNDVIWQSGELGKVDQGGGGTIAYILANRGAEVLDCGVPVLSMHGPYEVISKADLFMTYKGYYAFFVSN